MVHSTVERALLAVTPKMDAALAQYKADGQNCTAFEAMKAALGEHTVLMYPQEVPFKFIGCCEKNRGGFGASVAKAIANGVKHCKAGWSYDKATQGTIAVACNQGTDNYNLWMECNSNLSQSQGLAEQERLVGVSFGGTHSNLRLCTVDDECFFFAIAGRSWKRLYKCAVGWIH